MSKNKMAALEATIVSIDAVAPATFLNGIICCISTFLWGNMTRWKKYFIYCSLLEAKMTFFKKLPNPKQKNFCCAKMMLSDYNMHSREDIHHISRFHCVLATFDFSLGLKSWNQKKKKIHGKWPKKSKFATKKTQA